MGDNLEGHKIPKPLHLWIEGQFINNFNYTTNRDGEQITWVQFNFEDMSLAITLDCNKERHSMKFIIFTKEKEVNE